MRPDLAEAPASAFLILIAQVFMLVCLFLALLYEQAELALFALVLLVMGVGSNLWSRASLKHVDCQIALNRTRLFPDERLDITIRAINSKLLPLLLKIDVFAPKAIAGADKGQWISAQTGLLWYQQYDFSREFFPNKRGVYDLGPPLLRGGDLFGFFLRNKEIKNRFEVVVYPRIVKVRPVTIPKKEFYGIPGTQSPVEDPVYVFGTRDYQPGRPARRIHWKASSRYHRLLEKICEPAEQEKVLILLDVDGFDNEQAGQDFEKSLEVIASLVLQLDQRGIAIGFATNGKIFGKGSRIIPISRSHRQMASILEVLARIEGNTVAPLIEILAKGYRIPGGVSSMVFAFSRSNQTRSVESFMRHRNTPVRTILVQKPNADERRSGSGGKDTFFLENILIPEQRTS